MDTDEVHDGINSKSAGIGSVGADRISVAPALANGHEVDTSNNDIGNASTVVAAAVPSLPSTDEHVYVNFQVFLVHIITNIHS